LGSAAAFKFAAGEVFALGEAAALTDDAEAAPAEVVTGVPELGFLTGVAPGCVTRSAPAGVAALGAGTPAEVGGAGFTGAEATGAALATCTGGCAMGAFRENPPMAAKVAKVATAAPQSTETGITHTGRGLRDLIRPLSPPKRLVPLDSSAFSRAFNIELIALL
jgi:hypothetical protein